MAKLVGHKPGKTSLPKAVNALEEMARVLARKRVPKLKMAELMSKMEYLSNKGKINIKTDKEFIKESETASTPVKDGPRIPKNE